MAIYQLKTFGDIYSAVCEEIKLQQSDTTTLNRIKRDINTAYLNEVVPYEQWKWLRGYQDLVQEPYYGSSSGTTASVTLDSSTVTLTIAPALSRKGHWFSVDGWNEIYRIQAHTASALTLTLDVPYTGPTNTEASFKIWTDKIPLPVELRDTVEVTQNFHDEPLEGLGLQQFRRYVTSAPRAEGRPRYYTTSDYVDPTVYSTISGLPALSTRASSGVTKTLVFAASVASYLEVGDRIEVMSASNYTYNGEFTVASVATDTITYSGLTGLAEAAIADATLTLKLASSKTDSERHKELWVYPSLYATRTTLHVDYVKEATPLENAADEPLMPIGDRTVLLYGALMRAWSRERNPEEAQRNQALYERKLMKMAGKVDDSTDLPILKVGRTYLAGKRKAARYRSAKYSDGWAGSGGGSTSGSSSSPITNTANYVAVFNASGELDADDNITVSELLTLDGVTSNVQTQLDAITTLASANVYIGNASNVATELPFTGDISLDNTGLTAIAAGVIVDADVNASAAITRSKTATGTNYRILANDATGVMSENAALTADRPVISDTNGQLTTEATLAVARGGTNIASYTTGDLLHATGATTLSKLAIGTTGQALKVVAGDAAWGTLAEVGGGTNQTTYTTGDVLYASAANTLSKLSIGSSGQHLTVAAGIPAWGAASGILATSAKVFGDSPVTIANTVDAYTFDTSSGAISATLPDCATNAGKTFYLKKITSDFNAVTINRAGSDTIQGAGAASNSTTLDTQGEEIMLTSFGSTVWQIIQRRVPSVWVAYTPTCTVTSNATTTGFWRRLGDGIECAVQTAFNSTSTQNVSTTYTIPNSSAWTIDTAKLVNTTTSVGTLGFGIVHDTSAPLVVQCNVNYSSTTTVIARVSTIGATYVTTGNINPSTNVPITIASGDSFNFIFRVPITGLNG